MSKLPKITSLLFLYNMLRKKWKKKAVDFLHADKHESLLQIDTKIFDGYGQAFPKFPKKQICNVFTISLKKLEMKLTFLMQINIKVS